MILGERRRRDEEQTPIAPELREALIDCVEHLAHLESPRRSASRGAPGPVCCGVIV